jgi:hypothetical protein
MKKIKIYLEYQCYPMWVYNDNGELIDNNVLKELIEYTEISVILNEIQETYDNLFEDNEVDFEYKGFDSEADKLNFSDKIDRVVELIKSRIGKEYVVENKVNI